MPGETNMRIDTVEMRLQRMEEDTSSTRASITRIEHALVGNPEKPHIPGALEQIRDNAGDIKELKTFKEGAVKRFWGMVTAVFGSGGLIATALKVKG